MKNTITNIVKFPSHETFKEVAGWSKESKEAGSFNTVSYKKDNMELKIMTNARYFNFKVNGKQGIEFIYNYIKLTDWRSNSYKTEFSPATSISCIYNVLDYQV